MKKILLSLVALLVATSMSAQVIFSEDFEGVHLSQQSPAGALPTGWITYGDNLHTAQDLAWLGNNWAVAGLQGGGQVAACASYTQEDRNVDRWAVTPQINVNVANAQLRFEMGAGNAGYPETIKVKVSTTDNEKASFTDLSTMSVGYYQGYQIDLSAYENQNIYIAFVSCGNGVLAMMDNVKVGIFDPIGVELLSVNIPQYAASGEDLTIGGTFMNVGQDPITSFDAYYVVDGVTSAVTTVSGADVNIPYWGTHNFVINEPYNTTELGNHSIEVFVTNINGNSEATLTNNNMTGTVTVYDGADAFDRTVLLEQFTGQRCGYCPGGAQRIQQAINSNQNEVIWLAHHAGFGSDAMTVPENNTLTIFYNAGGDTYAPAYMVDRTRFLTSDPGPVVGVGDVASITNLINTAASAPAFGTINVESTTFNAETRELSIHVTGQVSESGNYANPRLSVYLMEDSIYGQQAGAGNIYHMRVMRDAITDVWGDAITGNTIDQTITYTVPAKFKVNHCKVLAFITNHSNDVNNRKVVNANITTDYVEAPYVGIDEVSSNVTMDVYPNPAIDFVTIGADNSIRSIRVVNTLGQIVYDNNSVNAEQVTLNTSNYSAGMYVVTVKTDEGVAVRRMTIAR